MRQFHLYLPRSGLKSSAERHAVSVGLAAYAAAMVVAVVAVAAGVEAFVRSIFDPPAKVAVAETEPREIRRGVLVPTQDTWADQLRDDAFWASRKTAGSGTFWKPPSGLFNSNNKPVASPFLQPALQQAPRVRRSNVDTDDGETTYRTVCVRLCDGAFFPVSFATTRGHFDEDEAKCERTCSGSRLFVYKNPGQDIEDMADLEGRAYKSLATAFLYKTTYNEQCKCRAHPWEDVSRDRHKVYALEAARAKGDRLAEVPLKELKAKLRQAELDERANKQRQAEAKREELKRQAAEARAARNNARLSGLANSASAKPPEPQTAPASQVAGATETLPPSTSSASPITTAAAPAAGVESTALKLPPPATPEATAALPPPRKSSKQTSSRTTAQTAGRPRSSSQYQPNVVTLRLGSSATVKVVTPGPGSFLTER